MTEARTTKACANCLLEKHRDEFYVSRRITGARPSRGALGVEAICKACKAHLRKPTLAAERQHRAELIAAGLKTCSTCKQEKTCDQFQIRKASPDGLCLICRQCANAKTALWKKANPDAQAEWYRQNKGHKHEYWVKWSATNRQRHQENYRRWAKANPERIRALLVKRRAAKLRATPSWANHTAIRAIYREANRLTKETGIKHDVDHVIPLRSKVVCGLHVEANLQILTSAANRQKSNRHQAA